MSSYARHLRACRVRMHAFGRLYIVAGGAPNRPTIILGATAHWHNPERAEWGGMQPRAIEVDFIWSAIADHGEVQRFVRDDIEDWRGEHDPNRRKPVVLGCETSQNPPLYHNIVGPSYEGLGSDVRTQGYRLRAADAQPHFSPEVGDVTLVGAAWLVPQFNAQVSPSADEVAGRVSVKLGDLKRAGGSYLGKEDLRSALSATESLFTKSVNASTDIALALNADEAVAAAIMIAWQTCGDNTPPSKGSGSDDPWKSGPLPSRGIQAVF